MCRPRAGRTEHWWTPDGRRCLLQPETHTYAQALQQTHLFWCFFSVHWDFTSSVHLHASQNGRKHHAMRPFLFLWSLQNSGQWRKDRLLNILKIICCQAAIMAHRWPGPVKQVWLISLSGLAEINNSSVSAEWMNKCLIKNILYMAQT